MVPLELQDLSGSEETSGSHTAESLHHSPPRVSAPLNAAVSPTSFIFQKFNQKALQAIKKTEGGRIFVQMERLADSKVKP